MKKLKKKALVFISIITLSLFTPSVMFANYPVFDVSNWLGGIDRFYQNYDMVMNTYTQIENQIKTIQHAVEVAKGIDWENIRFDGDFDIRNDIRDATKRVNKMLTQVNKIKKTLTTPSINCGNVKYSIADLAGCTTSDTWESRKNMLTAVQDYQYFMTNNMKEAVNGLENGLDEKQKKAIWRKYGISPSNYIYIQQATTMVADAASKAVNEATEEAKKLKAEEREARKNAILEAAMENVDSDGNPTQAGVGQATMFLTDQMIDELGKLGYSIDEMNALIGSYLVKQENEKQALADEEAARKEIDSESDNKESSRFIKE